MDRVDVEGLQIAFERAGGGPAVVLVHGFVGDGPSTWGAQIEALSEDFTVVAWDGPGAGASSDPPEWFRAATTPTASWRSSGPSVSPRHTWSGCPSVGPSRSRCSRGIRRSPTRSDC